jgi:hypothetical protein
MWGNCVMKEDCINPSAFCPNCGSVLCPFGNTKPVADFYCGNCSEAYELKSKNGNVGKKIVDGAYATTPKTIGTSWLNDLFQYLHFFIKGCQGRYTIFQRCTSPLKLPVASSPPSGERARALILSGAANSNRVW